MKCAIFAGIMDHEKIRYIETIEVEGPAEAILRAKNHSIKMYTDLEKEGKVLSFADCLKEVYQNEVNTKEGVYEKASHIYQNEVERFIRYYYDIIPKEDEEYYEEI